MKRPSVVLIGPWNFHSGAGEACRGNLKALWQLQQSYRIYPMGVPCYGPHRMFSSINASLPVNLNPDVVIVHLNPDTAPALLTQQQRGLLERANHRVGYWLWETMQVPQGWGQALSWVDSIWVPSQYCEQLFAGLTERPIRIIPHVVEEQRAGHSVAANQQSSRTSRTILYIFDGASYLRRKNPAALVRAFHQAGLAEDGWRLCLKTKNLNPAGYDPDYFEDFQRALAEARHRHADSIELIDADFNDAQLRSLLQSAAIYASPHASEGFGLTIAEAMAAGVLVVATDYGGTHDLLDPNTGFPVKFHLIAEPLGFGSYQEGCVWAKVDEKHLSEQLRAAAQVSESAVGLSIRQAAQIKLASRCSLKVVAKRIDAALQEIL